MTQRAAIIDDFLRQNNLAQATRQDFAADFSPRRYTRFYPATGPSVILMDADADQRTHAFVQLAAALRGFGLSAPEIYAADPDRGLVLMEDFGDRNCGVLADAKGDAKDWCLLAAPLLNRLHEAALQAELPADLPRFDAARLTEQVGLYAEAYLPFRLHRPATAMEKAGFAEAWARVLQPVAALPHSLMLRDFMLDNLMHLPHRQGGQALGVLDFQDAGTGPMAYDLASLCEQVRRDLDADVLPDVIALYCRQSPLKIPAAEWLQACHIMAAQRHMRVMGVIARLAAKGRNDKRAYLPRIEKYLAGLLRDHRLAPVRDWLCKTGMME